MAKLTWICDRLMPPSMLAITGSIPNILRSRSGGDRRILVVGGGRSRAIVHTAVCQVGLDHREFEWVMEGIGGIVDCFVGLLVDPVGCRLDRSDGSHLRRQSIDLGLGGPEGGVG